MQGRGYRLRIPGNIQTVGAFDPNMKVPETLTADRTYYVRKDGSDSNNGRYNTAAGAWLTIQKALDWVSQNVRIPRNVSVTVQVGDGVYAENLSVAGSKLGGLLILQGNTSNFNAVVIQAVSGVAVLADFGAYLRVRYFYFHSGGGYPAGTGSPDFVVARHAATITIERCVFTKTTGAHMVASQGGIIEPFGAYKIQGGATYHLLATQASLIRYSPPFTITIDSNPVFSTFVRAEMSSVIQFYVGAFVLWSITGSVSGQRYLASVHGVVYVAGVSATWLPGSTAGVAEHGGIYV